MTKSKEQLAFDAVMAIQGSSISASKRRYIEEAMDLYAKSQAINLLTWVISEGWEYSCYETDTWFKGHEPSSRASTEELYKVFLQSQQP